MVVKRVVERERERERERPCNRGEIILLVS